MDVYKALQILALRAVTKPEADGEYTLRHIFRWYSKTFSTPLHEVSALPVEDVLTAYWESKYEEMTEPERNSEIEQLLITDEELTELQRLEDWEDASSQELIDDIVKEEGPSKSPAETMLKAPKVGPLRPLNRDMDLPPDLPQRLPPEIKMNFVTAEEFEQELDQDSMGGRPRR